VLVAVSARALKSLFGGRSAISNYFIAKKGEKKMFEYFTKKRIKFGYDFETDRYKDIVVSESTTAVYNSEKAIRGQSHEHEKNHFADIQDSSPKCDYPAGQICLRCHNPIPYEYCRNCNQLATGLKYSF
jgi:hypothetical protein